MDEKVETEYLKVGKSTEIEYILKMGKHWKRLFENNYCSKHQKKKSLEHLQFTFRRYIVHSVFAGSWKFQAILQFSDNLWCLIINMWVPYFTQC